eukprot:7410563-Pyramimonas_sp.AAC.1
MITSKDVHEHAGAATAHQATLMLAGKGNRRNIMVASVGPKQLVLAFSICAICGADLQDLVFCAEGAGAQGSSKKGVCSRLP